MGGRYVVTGVQLAFLRIGVNEGDANAINVQHAIKELNNIESNQYIGESNQDVVDDATILSNTKLIR
jgi:hypothetical protein